MGLEPTTASLEGWRSAIELRPRKNHVKKTYFRYILKKPWLIVDTILDTLATIGNNNIFASHCD